jgi:hypothetical protein
MYLDEQLTVAQLAERLETLRFDKHEHARVVIDPGVQNFLLAVTRAAAAGRHDQKVRHIWRLIRP